MIYSIKYISDEYRKFDDFLCTEWAKLNGDAKKFEWWDEFVPQYLSKYNAEQSTISILFETEEDYLLFKLEYS